MLHEVKTYSFPSEYSAALFMFFCKGVDEGRDQVVEYKLTKQKKIHVVTVGKVKDGEG